MNKGAIMDNKTRRLCLRMIERNDFTYLDKIQGNITGLISSQRLDYLICHTARSDKHLNATKCLIRRKANVSVHCETHMMRGTPLAFAVANLARKTAQLLIDAGASINEGGGYNDFYYYSCTTLAERPACAMIMHTDKIPMMKVMIRAGAKYDNKQHKWIIPYLAQGRENCRRTALALRHCFIRRGADRSMVDSLLLKQYVLKTLDDPNWLNK